MLLVLVRHGESTSNVAGLWQGHGDAPLSRRGREQAEQLAPRLEGVPFDVVISSDLSRARDTAALAAGRTPRTDPGLREADVGAWEGLPRAAIAARFPEQLDALMQNRTDVPLGGGESLGAFWSRVDAAVDRLATEVGPRGRALVFSHGGVIAGLVAGLLGRRGKPRGDLRLARFANTGVTVLRRDQGAFRIVGLNCVAHLDPSAIAEEDRKQDGGRVVRIDAHPDAPEGATRDATDGEATGPLRATPADAHRLALSLLGAEAPHVEPLTPGAHVHVLRSARGVKLVDIGSRLTE